MASYKRVVLKETETDAKSGYATNDVQQQLNKFDTSYTSKKLNDLYNEFDSITFNSDVASSTIVKENAVEKVNAKIGDHEGIVDIGRSIDGVEVSIFLHEKDGMYKVSLRSNSYVNVSEIGAIFNGGGHINAAGFASNLPLLELKNKLIEEITKRL